jgi:uncharacterized integral membrane protein
MKALLKWLLLVPVAVIVILLAIANRGPATVTFDPFSGADPQFSVTVPMFLILFAAVAIGVVLGGIASWLNQARYRREAREAKAAVARAEAEVKRLRAQTASYASLPAPSGAQRAA